MSDREHTWVMWMTIWGLLCLLWVLLAGCADRQNASDAHAGTRAIQQHHEATEDVARIAGGVGDHVLATVGAESPQDLPDPHLSPEEIRGDPGRYEEQAAGALEEALSSPWAWVAGGAMAVLAALRAVPGTPGAISRVIYAIIGSKSDKRAKRREEQITGMAPMLLETLNGLAPEQYQAVREQARASFPGWAWDQFLELEKEKKP